MPTRLSLYNGALTVHLGEPPLSALTDDVPARYALDGVWDREGVRRCLQAGQWNFAARSAGIEYDPGITPQIGYAYAFEKPSDYVRTLGVFSDASLKSPYPNYDDEGAYIWSDLQTIYLRFVSDDNQYGGDLSLWPANFTAYAESFFADQIKEVVSYKDAEALEAKVKRLLLDAQNTDAMGQPPKRAPRGSWASARGTGHRSDLGSMGRLTG